GLSKSNLSAVDERHGRGDRCSQRGIGAGWIGFSRLCRRVLLCHRFSPQVRRRWRNRWNTPPDTNPKPDAGCLSIHQCICGWDKAVGLGISPTLTRNLKEKTEAYTAA